MLLTVLISVLQMYPQNGSSLPVDGKLRFSPHFPSFLSLPALCSRLNVLS